MPQSTIQFGDAIITVEGRTARARLRNSRYQRILDIASLDDNEALEYTFYALFYLAHISDVDGSLGFAVPNGNATQESLTAFVDDFLGADESLMEAIDTAIVNASHVTNDLDLLPPDEISPKNVQSPKPKKGDGPNKKPRKTG